MYQFDEKKMGYSKKYQNLTDEELDKACLEYDKKIYRECHPEKK